MSPVIAASFTLKDKIPSTKNHNTMRYDKKTLININGLTNAS